MNLLLIGDFLLSTDVCDHPLQLLAELLTQIDGRINRGFHRTIGTLQNCDRVIWFNGLQTTRVLDRPRNFQSQLLANDLLTSDLVENQAAPIGGVALKIATVEQTAFRGFLFRGFLFGRLLFGLCDLTADGLDLQCRLRVQQQLGLPIRRIKFLNRMSDSFGIALLPT